MAIGFRGMAIGGLLGVAGAIATATALTPTANAQEPETVLDALENIAENRSGDYYTRRSAFRQLEFITGIGGFPDQRTNRDAAAISEAYDALLMLQNQNTATVRVPDLPNPYTTSVQLLPASQFGSRVTGSELNFEPLPRR